MKCFTCSNPASCMVTWSHPLFGKKEVPYCKMCANWISGAGCPENENPHSKSFRPIYPSTIKENTDV